MNSIRPAHEGDLPAISEIHVRSWQSAYVGIVPDQILQAKDVPAHETMWRGMLGRYPGNLLVAVDERASVLGFSYVAAVTDQPDDLPYDGRVYALHVGPHLKRQGIGSQLFDAAIDRLRDLRCGSIIVWTFKELAPSRRFYEQHGGVVVKSKFGEFEGTNLAEVAYGWGDPGDGPGD